MNQALFESLTGTFSDGTPLSAIPKNKRVVFSIMDNLNRLFNTRKDSLPHLKDYGLPDISEIYRKMPVGIQVLENAILKTVELYEPRLRNVRVIRQEDDIKASRLVFILECELVNGSSIRFQTTFVSTGNSTISPWKQPQ
ncbi:MAG: type VI secretion system baseplate subunit TssE [Chitinispirillia bacterium]|jgi:type VI secretion system protein